MTNFNTYIQSLGDTNYAIVDMQDETFVFVGDTIARFNSFGRLMSVTKN